MFMFTGFSNKANAALNSAVGCAEDMGHTYIGSEHILAGLLKDPTNVASVILSTKKINYQTFYEVIRMNKLYAIKWKRENHPIIKENSSGLEVRWREQSISFLRF